MEEWSGLEPFDSIEVPVNKVRMSFVLNLLNVYCTGLRRESMFK